MAGTKAGGKAAAATNLSKYGPNFYKHLGEKGGKAKVPKGFAMNRELARAVGALGGRQRVGKRYPRRPGA